MRFPAVTGSFCDPLKNAPENSGDTNPCMCTSASDTSTCSCADGYSNKNSDLTLCVKTVCDPSANDAKCRCADTNDPETCGCQAGYVSDGSGGCTCKQLWISSNFYQIFHSDSVVFQRTALASTTTQTASCLQTRPFNVLTAMLRIRDAFVHLGMPSVTRTTTR